MQNNSVDHYENFPIASFLVPKDLRTDIVHIYRFARTADDIADDINLPSDQKIHKLKYFREQLDILESSLDPLFINLNKTVLKRNLSIRYFYDLLDAFDQDVTNPIYLNFDQLKLYASKSANPVGRLMLELFNFRGAQLNIFSDKICTGLQFINFWQDLSIDKNMNRFYVPLDILKNHNITMHDFYFSDNQKVQTAVIRQILDFTERDYSEGKDLIKHLKGRFKLELKMIYLGGETILIKAKKLNYLLLNTRPKIKTMDVLSIFLKMLI